MKFHTSSLRLHDLLSGMRADLTAALIRRLRAANADHYRLMAEPELRERIETLYGFFLRAVAARPAIFAKYLEGIALSRISEGVALREIQIILQILEDLAWQAVIERLPLEEQVSCLGLVTATIGAAKDQLAQTYLEYLERTELEAARLQHRLDELAKGTDCGPLDDEDLPRPTTGPRRSRPYAS